MTVSRGSGRTFRVSSVDWLCYAARIDFQRLKTELISEEVIAIPELQETVTEMGLSHHPAFSNIFTNESYP